MKLFIIIVSFNGGETLVKLIDDLINEKKNNTKIDINLVVVENGREEKFRIDTIKSKKNLGFAGGCNIGIRYALQNNADRILLLNQDVVIKPGFIQTFINNPADIISPVIQFKRGNNWVYDFGGKVNWSIGRNYHIESTSKLISQQANQPIDYVSGCCMLVKREVFEKIGLFDERFFLYFEDADFCIRAKKAGFQIAVEPKGVIVHNLVEGAKKPLKSQMELVKSNAIFINKYLRLNRLLGYLYLLVLSAKIWKNRVFAQSS